ncbi:MAG TPA: MFS transporter [Candidatus Eisenbacteria bacterium]|nr:MFS transporter [Candidatus Eisenbacteria bacterium]
MSMGSNHEKTSVRWFVASMVGAFAFVSYLERMNISIAAAAMMPELSLSPTQMGQVFSSFLWGYAIFQVPVGWAGDAFGPRRILTIAALLWCLTTALTGFLPGTLVTGTVLVIVSLCALRFLLGAAEAATFPVGARAIREWTPLHERGVGNSMMIAGASIAAAVTSPLVSWLMVFAGWRKSFLITSLVALLLAIIWQLSVTDRPEQHKWVGAWELRLIKDGRTENRRARSSRSLRSVLTDRDILLLSLSYTCEGYVLFIFVFWLYLYLIQVRGFTLLSGGFAASLPWLTAFASAPLGGFVCDKISERRGRVPAARTTIMIGYAISGVMLFAAAFAGGRAATVAALCLSIGGLYFAEPGFWATAVHISGERAGVSAALMNTAGIVGGIVSTSLVPILVKHFGWITALASGAAVALACTTAWIVMGKVGFAADKFDSSEAASAAKH